jgi:hypothetical protein
MTKLIYLINKSPLTGFPVKNDFVSFLISAVANETRSSIGHKYKSAG